MSRIGQKPIKIVNNVTVEIIEGGLYGNCVVLVKGPKGELSQDIRTGVKITKTDETTLLVERNSDSKQNKGYHGLYRTLITNMIIGVTEGYEKNLEIHGVGFKVQPKGNDLEFKLGWTHPVIFSSVEGISFEIKDGVDIKVKGINKELVGEVAAKIRMLKKPEVYKGKGIRYAGEHVRRKEGKAGAK